MKSISLGLAALLLSATSFAQTRLICHNQTDHSGRLILTLSSDPKSLECDLVSNSGLEDVSGILKAARLQPGTNSFTGDLTSNDTKTKAVLVVRDTVLKMGSGQAQLDGVNYSCGLLAQ